jgi:hypothetical protein
MFEYVRVCSNMFEYVRICSAVLGHVRLPSGAAGCCGALNISQCSSPGTHPTGQCRDEVEEAFNRVSATTQRRYLNEMKGRGWNLDRAYS